MKIRFYIAGIAMVTASSFAASAASVPHTFVAGEPINATEMNNNFSDLKQQIINLETKVDAIPAPISGGGSGSNIVVFEGFSSASVLPNIGYLGMNNACKATYTGSRMCTSEEVIGDSNVTSLPAGANAWVRPLPVQIFDGGRLIAYDKTSVVRTPTSCNDWVQQGTVTGMGVDEFLIFRNYSCNTTTNYVACCSVR